LVNAGRLWSSNGASVILISALSATPDAGFANPANGADAHPWASGTAVQYTVQA